MDCQTYRIEVSTYSSLYHLFIFFVFFLWLSAVWLWPYYMPDSYRFGFSTILFLVFAFEVKGNRKKASEKVLSVSQIGRVVIYTENNIEAGWLQSCSRNYLGFFYLNYLPELKTNPQSLVIYADQINAVERRRLSRIISAIKFNKVD